MRMNPSRLAVGLNGRRVPSGRKVERARLYPAHMMKLGATRPLRKFSHSGIRPRCSQTFTQCTSIMTMTAQPRRRSSQSQRFEGVRSFQCMLFIH